ncbi:hypothetical protein [Hymenobacter cellulosilyticus]|uniref:Anti-sigma factor n=1 Tax=Hymenobacter cellulosilyticus TaxID=2932248 RepID=A0A8T9Q4K3_9BACT|nr:hypothetical protein [Hymenobacter cellulosilyticus]UOQ72437.1 hypothetical protein MUN79_00005 [Hymenobacter cellulosilyticus]
MKEKKTGLEDFVDRHRGDFDAFEPRPDLWDAIEAELSAAPAAASEEAPLRIVKLQPEEEIQTPAAAPTPVIRAPRRYNYGVAAALALLLLAGLGAMWSKSASSASTGWVKAASAPLVLSQPEEPTGSVSGFGASAVGIEAASPQKRLAVAVQRMEDYYATQIGEKKAEISELHAPVSPAATADWRQELATLDSTYNQLKVELYRNPEPDVVLEAMNRNMQIRLDILNQQLRLQERMKEYNAANPAVEKELKP